MEKEKAIAMLQTEIASRKELILMLECTAIDRCQLEELKARQTMLETYIGKYATRESINAIN